MAETWTKSSWRRKHVAQAVEYPDVEALSAVTARLGRYPALVFEGEVSKLKTELARAARGEAFLLQGGDCAESFDRLDGAALGDGFRVLLQMAVVMTFAAKKPVIKVGRIAGQFAKPRSSPTETRDGRTLTAYRGDIVNAHEFSPDARRPDPARMERAYFTAAATLNGLRASAAGGFADLKRIQSWNREFLGRSGSAQRYRQTVERINEAVEFMVATGADLSRMSSVDFFTSHEALLLPYEEALVRASEGGPAYAGSGHMLWIGERTRDLDGAHVEFARGIANPIGLKVGPSLRSDELLRLIDRLNPEDEPGRLTLIPRLGVRQIEQVLPKLARRVHAEGRHVVWACDPMHGNTYTSASGFKTRSFDEILGETRAFFEILRAESCVPGGVHFELTGRDVIECIGGGQEIRDEDLNAIGYETLCDPRLNAQQALELAFDLSESLRRP